MTWANSSVTVTRMLQTKFEVNLPSSFREEDDCCRMTTDVGVSRFDTNSSPWAFGSGKLKNKQWVELHKMLQKSDLKYISSCKLNNNELRNKTDITMHKIHTDLWLLKDTSFQNHQHFLYISYIHRIYKIYFCFARK
jgi:hypothetical protein